MKVIKYSSLIMVACSLLSCATIGNVSRGYNDTREKIWYAMKEVMNKHYNGIKRMESDPPTVYSNLSFKDQQFGIDKTAYQVVASLSGFTRPYMVDVEVRVYPDGEERMKYSTDGSKAQLVMDQIAIMLYDKKYNTSLQEEFAPY